MARVYGQLAHACSPSQASRAADLRRAAIALTPGLAEAFEERAAIMEYDGGLTREQAEIGAAVDTLTNFDHGMLAF